MIDIYKILEKYQPDEDILSEEEDDTPSRKIKEIIYRDLDEVDRRIILMYAELGSLRKLAREIGVSSTACHFRIKAIRNKILQLIRNDGNKPSDNR